MAKDTRSPQEILAHIITSRVALTLEIFGLSEAELSKAGAVGTWSVKDVMAHIARWEEVCLVIIQKQLNGEQIEESYRDPLAFNDTWEADFQATPVKEIIEQFETAHYRLFVFLSGLPEEKWNGFVRAWVRGSTWHHFEEHAPQISAWRTTLSH